MRFILMISADAGADAGLSRVPAELAGMPRGVAEMARAGVLLDAAGLHPSARGALVELADSRCEVTEGPLLPRRSPIAGYVVIQARSRAEAIAWARRYPVPPGGRAEIEIRQLFAPDDLLPPNADVT